MLKTSGPLTNASQPNHTVQPNNSQNSQSNPQRRSHIETQPEETLVCCGDGAGVRVRGLKNPVRVAGGGVDFVPPAQTDKAAAGDVLEVVKVRGEEEQGEDEDQDAVFMVRSCRNDWVACARRFNVQVINEENTEQVHQ